ncbi:alginate O-acetyltransferase [bacterium]|nr:alginate O-acetyltransferase [bacterium]|tara:strand:+ start:2541 stop:4013 length:1473 start_codon:yes stop_codon:yes gene_type:complete
MLFTTVEFIVFFIAVLTAIVCYKNRKFQHTLLVVASFFFLYFSDSYLVLLLVYTTILHYFIGKKIAESTDPKNRKILLGIGIGGSLGLLGFFKYTDFAISQINELFGVLGFTEIPFLNLILPIGISFYTFQSISYIIDIYRGSLKPTRSILQYGLFVAFFPTLVAGPILRASDFLPQLNEKISNLKSQIKLKQFFINNRNLKLGITMMAIGFLKKLFFADNIAPMVDNVFNSPIGHESFTIILGTIGFGFQVYGDFSGYSDIAIGAALIIGINVPPNFRKPFFSTSPSDFWRRWHISLSTWVRDYLYFPLIFKNRKSSQRLFSSLFTSFFLLGLWHGAGWNFIIFGIIHGIYVAVDTLVRKQFPNFSKNKFFKTKIGKITSILITQFLIFFAFISFRVRDVDEMVYSMKKYLIWDFEIDGTINFIQQNEFAVILIPIFLILQIITLKIKNVSERISSLQVKHWLIFLTIIMLLVVLFYRGSAEEFIYFEF